MMCYKNPTYKVADVFRLVENKVIGATGFSLQQQNVARAICQCRTPALGGHIRKCDNCGKIELFFNSCRDRHCPCCGGLKREKWLLERKQELLPVTYYHVVFTIPHLLNTTCLKYPVAIYNLLFRSAWDTVKAFGDDPKYLGAKTGMIAILHTWGQTLLLHPHLHCMVPEGGITVQNQWRFAKKSHNKFLFPVKAMGKVFRGKFVDGLIKLVKMGRVEMENPPQKGNKASHPLYKQKWVVYAKRPVAGADQIIEYLGRYTSKVAISNYRINYVDQDQVNFNWKDYRDNKIKTMSLDPFTFVSRFLLHVLPPKFVKARYYGIFSCRKKKAIAQLIACICLSKKVPEKHAANTWQEVYRIAFGKEPFVCPKCKKGKLMVVRAFEPIRDGPKQADKILKELIKQVA